MARADFRIQLPPPRRKVEATSPTAGKTTRKVSGDGEAQQESRHCVTLVQRSPQRPHQKGDRQAIPARGFHKGSSVQPRPARLKQGFQGCFS